VARSPRVPDAARPRRTPHAAPRTPHAAPRTAHAAPRTAHFARLYAILDIDLIRARGLDPNRLVDAWLTAGVRLVQLRAKSLGGGRMLDLADSLGARTRSAGGIFIVNDRADIACMADAAGVHVGQDDLTPRAVRRIVGPRRLVGCSTHEPRQVEAACREPIDYLAIGPVFRTRTKQGARDAVVGLSGVRDACDRAAASGLPVVAIGGITLARAADVLGAGAASVAVISDLLTGDPTRRARDYLQAVAG